MGLRDVLQRAAITIRHAAGDIPETATLHHLAYDSQGQPTGTDEQSVTLPVIQEQYLLEKVDDVNTLRNQRQYRAMGLDLRGLVPREDDTLEVDGGTWTVQLVQPDAARASYVLHVRR